MKIHVRFHKLQRSKALQSYAEKRMQKRLSKFAHELSEVVIRFVDVNGPRGGLDKRCQVTLRGPRLGGTTLSQLGTCAYETVDLVLKRVVHTVSRKVARSRSYAYQPKLLDLPVLLE